MSKGLRKFHTFPRPRDSGIVFSINRNRMDEAQWQEDAATAGEWIQYIELWPADSYND